MMAGKKGWYYLQEESRHSFVRGPCTTSEIMDLIRRGIIGAKTQLRPGMDDPWYPAAHYPLFKNGASPGNDGRRVVRKTIVFSIVGALCVALVILSFWNRVPPAVTQLTPSVTVEGVIACTNKARHEIMGLPPLSEESSLNAIAAERLKDMIEKQYFAHESPSGEVVSDVAYRVGYRYKRLGENIAMGHLNTDERMVRGWIQSPGHRENILSTECTDIGVAVGRGIMNGQETWIGVQVFGLKSPPVTHQSSRKEASRSSQGRDCIQPDAGLLTAINEAKKELSAFDDATNRLRQELDESKPKPSVSGKGFYGYEPGRETEAIDGHNQKVEQYNRVLYDLRSKTKRCDQMIAQYNDQLERYKACSSR